MGRYNLTQHTTTLPVVCHFTSCVLLKNHRTSLGPDPKIRSKRSSLTSSLCFTDLGLLRPPLGGADRNRTDDPLLAKQVLSQLSYSPVLSGRRTEDRSGASETFHPPRFFRLPSSVIRLLAWWVWMDSNHRPPPYQDGALTN